MTSGVIIAVVVVYLLVLLGLGLWGRRDSGSVAGYFLAGKRFTPAVSLVTSPPEGAAEEMESVRRAVKAKV